MECFVLGCPDGMLRVVLYRKVLHSLCFVFFQFSNHSIVKGDFSTVYQRRNSLVPPPSTAHRRAQPLTTPPLPAPTLPARASRMAITHSTDRTRLSKYSEFTNKHPQIAASTCLLPITPPSPLISLENNENNVQLCADRSLLKRCPCHDCQRGSTKL